MRTHFLALCTVVLCMAAPAAAQDRGYPVVGPPSASSLDVAVAARARRYMDQDLDYLRGGYALSNGWRLALEPGHNGIWVRIDRQRPMRLAAVYDDVFVTHDGRVVLIFDRERGELVLRYPPQSGLAVVSEARAALAQR